MKTREIKKGDRVIITSGKYNGQTGIVSFIFKNGAMVERDIKKDRRFCTVMFNHLLDNLKNL